MWPAVGAFIGGFACRHQCSNLPCRARLSPVGRPFKLSVLVHSTSLHGNDGPGLVQNQRPYVGVTVGDKTKETELGDWSKERGQWAFREILTMEVTVDDEFVVVVSGSTRYNLLVASVSLTSCRIGEICVPVVSVLPRLRVEDRDTDGMVYATPVLPFDVVLDGRNTGRVYLSFETKTQPPSPKMLGAHRFCGIGGSGLYRSDQETDASDAETDVPYFRKSTGTSVDSWSGGNWVMSGWRSSSP
eukprot:gnl/TRDRNA2_/TRDRNA2_42059_c0_seq1.p1 gnl/TRDRNA2_/TRDRNA2_42059_c0~~gnl/TRDRNA2_/TRDRNA2_42059_c0_seq1.p1  ORF type:complete len:244 (-),score=29.38 gnl/TRDRNA2_/TRDRNA2_42059_c0_seq1:229-960(-)